MNRWSSILASSVIHFVHRCEEGPDWTYEVKLDGYRAIGVKTSRDTILYSRNGKDFNKRFPQIAKALGNLPATQETSL
jgi:bifunctional non-homologous end joining protein LigD